MTDRVGNSAHSRVLRACRGSAPQGMLKESPAEQPVSAVLGVPWAWGVVSGELDLLADGNTPRCRVAGARGSIYNADDTHPRHPGRLRATPLGLPTLTSSSDVFRRGIRTHPGGGKSKGRRGEERVGTFIGYGLQQLHPGHSASCLRLLPAVILGTC